MKVPRLLETLGATSAPRMATADHVLSGFQCLRQVPCQPCSCHVMCLCPLPTSPTGHLLGCSPGLTWATPRAAVCSGHLGINPPNALPRPCCRALLQRQVPGHQHAGHSAW